MVVIDKQLNDMTKEKRILEQKVDDNPDDQESKRLLKNVRERIRVRIKKLSEQPEVAETPIKPLNKKKQKQFGVKTPSMKSILLEEYNKGDFDCKEISKRLDYPLTSVQWYMSSFKKQNKK